MSEPIRILHVIGIMNRGGAETMIMNLYRHMDRTKVQFDFVENSAEPAAFDDEIQRLGGKIYRCPHYNGKNHFTYVKWWNCFFREHRGEYPIVHGHLGSTAAIYLSIAKKYGAYTIAHSHNTRTQLNLGEIIYAVYSFPTRYIANQLFSCSRVAAISRYGAKRGGEKSQCIIINNAISTDMFSLSQEHRMEIRNELNLGEQLVIGHVGRFNPQKNHPFLLEIFSALLKKEPSAVLLLVGGGEDLPKIQAKAQTLGIAENIRFLGVRSDVADLMQAMDVFVFPSLYEGLPVTMVEAQASGLPCLISDKVPEECIITEGLVDVMPLSASADAWAEKVLEKRKCPRTDHSEEVAAHGFDIEAEALKLQEFYQNVYQNQQ